VCARACAIVCACTCVYACMRLCGVVVLHSFVSAHTRAPHLHLNPWALVRLLVLLVQQQGVAAADAAALPNWRLQADRVERLLSRSIQSCGWAQVCSIYWFLVVAGDEEDVGVLI